MSAAARERLAAVGVGYRPIVVGGDGATGWSAEAPYDRIFVSFTVPRVPTAVIEQIAPGGRALMTIGTSSPSWPGLAAVSRRPDGEIEAELRAVEFGHRAGVGLGYQRLFLSAAFRQTITTAEGRTHRSRLAPPADTARGMRLALDAMHPGAYTTVSRGRLYLAVILRSIFHSARGPESCYRRLAVSVIGWSHVNAE